MRLQRRKGKKGQSLVEYALVLVLVAVVSIAVLSLLGQAVKRPVAVVAGSLGAQKNGVNGGAFENIYVHSPSAGVGKAACTIISGVPTITTTIDVSSDITVSDIMISIEGTVLNQAGAGTGSIAMTVTTVSGRACPNSMVIQAKRALVIVPIVAS